MAVNISISFDLSYTDGTKKTVTLSPIAPNSSAAREAEQKIKELDAAIKNSDVTVAAVVDGSETTITLAEALCSESGAPCSGIINAQKVAEEENIIYPAHSELSKTPTHKIVYESTAPSGNKFQRTISYVNPSATNEQLYNFVTALNSLTNNTYGESSRLAITSLDGSHIIPDGENIFIVPPDDQNAADTLAQTLTADKYTDSWQLIITNNFSDGDTNTLKLENPCGDLETADIERIANLMLTNQIILGDKSGAAFTNIKKAVTRRISKTIFDLRGVVPQCGLGAHLEN